MAISANRFVWIPTALALFGCKSESWRASDSVDRKLHWDRRPRGGRNQMPNRTFTGFSLVEALVAVGLVATIAIGVAPLFGVAAGRNRAARLQTLATLLAAQKLEELKAEDPAGLDRSPEASLETDIPGFVDYLDERGALTDDSTRRAAFIRRWSIEPLPANPSNVLVLQVLVTSPGREPGRGWRSEGARVAGLLRMAR